MFAFYLVAVSFEFLMNVFAPKNEYKGQKDTTLVTIKIPAKISNTIPAVPTTVSVINKPMKTAAISNRMILSVVPIFFFMLIYLEFEVKFKFHLTT